MLKYLLPIVVALMMAPAYFVERADAAPAMPHALAQVAPAPAAQPVYCRRGWCGGRWRVGGRYYGGVWYGAGVRRWYGGRWWPYGVGSCWRTSPIGYVWVCG